MNEKIKLKASQTNDIKLLLLPYFFFRAAIKFRNEKPFHPYGDEHSCTYKQVKTGYVKEIVLNAHKGYFGLLKYIEGKIKAGEIKSVKIFGREVPGAEFSILHRSWYGGKWEEINDPVIEEKDLQRVVPHQVVNGRVEITDNLDEPLPNFKDEVNKALNKPRKPGESQ